MENTRIMYLQCGVYKSTGGGSDQLGFIVVLESTFLEPAESPLRICLLRASSTSSSLGPSLLPATSGASSSLPLHTTASKYIPVSGTIKCKGVSLFTLPHQHRNLPLLLATSVVSLLLYLAFHYTNPSYFQCR